MANLATMIIEGIMPTKKNDLLEVSGYDYSKDATMESYYLNSAIVTLYESTYQAECEYMISDVIMSAEYLRSRAVNESYNIESVFEGVFGDFINKIIEAIKKFWAKLVAWFKHIIEWFKVQFMNSKEFINKYGNELMKKKYKGFTYVGHHYNVSQGDKFFDEVKDKIGIVVDKLFGMLVQLSGTTNIQQDDSAYDKTNKVLQNLDNTSNMNIATMASINKTEKEGEEEEEALFKEIGVKNVSNVTELGEAIRANYYYDHGDTETPNDTIEDFEYHKPNEMINYLKKADKTISDIQKHAKEIERTIDKVIKLLEKFKSNNQNEKKKEIIEKHVSIITRNVRLILNAIKTINDNKVKMHKKIQDEWTSVLKKFWNFKPAEESTMVFYPEYDVMM